MRTLRIIRDYALLAMLPLRYVWFSTLVVALVPAVLFVFFGIGGSDRAPQFSAAYAMFIAINSAMGQAAYATAGDRLPTFENWTTNLPVPTSLRLTGRSIGGYIILLVSLLPLISVVAVTASSSMPAILSALAATLLTAGIFSAIGIIVGMLFNREVISSVITVIFFVLVACGGIFTAGDRPAWVPAPLFEAMPTVVIFDLVYKPGIEALIRYLLWIGALVLIIAWLNRRQAIREY